MQFTPLKDFYSEELKSQYCVGLSYTIKARYPNPAIPGDKGTPADQTPLAKLLPTWIKEGKVREGLPTPVADKVKVSGSGTVK